jgi:phage internal scaffolding protein
MEKIITKRENGSVRIQYKTNGTCKVQKHLKDECDLEKMVERYKRTGQIRVMGDPKFGEWSQIASYHDAQNAIIATQEAFAKVPSKIRQKFDNDPQKLIDFIEDPKNLKECVELGLVDKSVLKSEKSAEPAKSAKSAKTEKTTEKKDSAKKPE